MHFPITSENNIIRYNVFFFCIIRGTTGQINMGVGGETLASSLTLTAPYLAAKHTVSFLLYHTDNIFENVSKHL